MQPVTWSSPSSPTRSRPPTGAPTPRRGPGLARPPLRWAVVIVDLDPTEGHEQTGSRRALVVGYKAFHRSGLRIVCPITAARSTPRYPGEIAIPTGEAGQTKDELILCAEVRTISARRIRTTGILPCGRRPPHGRHMRIT